MLIIEVAEIKGKCPVYKVGDEKRQKENRA